MLSSLEKYQTFTESLGAILWQADARTLQWNFINQEAERLLGYPVEQWLAASSFWQDRIHPHDREEVISTFMKAANEGTPIDLEYRMIGSLGQIVWFKNIVRTTEQDGSRQLIGIMVDITKNKKTEEQLTYHALHDALTGLPNRLLLLDRLEQMLAGALRGYDESFALLFIDLDGFKQINDSFGHLIGDEVLVEVAGRLSRCLRRSDTLARMGGDEFVVLTERVKTAGGARLAACRLLEALEAPFYVGEEEVRIGASIGIAVSSGNYWKPEAILHDADQAMYRAKADGGRSCKVFVREADDDITAVAI